MRAAAALQITSSQAQRQTEHGLQPFADLLEPNPRAMKRLVNAYGFHQANHFLEGRDGPPEALARWTIVDLRWPVLGEYLARHPERVEDVAQGGRRRFGPRGHGHGRAGLADHESRPDPTMPRRAARTSARAG